MTTSGHEGEEHYRSAIEHADQRRLEQAAESCLKASKAEPLEPRYRYLLAMIELERGREAEAAQALIKAVYLDPDSVLPHVALGNLRQNQGRHSDAVRHFEAALGLLQKLPADEEINQADGLNAAQLASLVESARARHNEGAIATTPPRAQARSRA